MAMKKPGKKKVGDVTVPGLGKVGTSPSGRYGTQNGRVVDPTTMTPFVKGQPHPTPKPVSMLASGPVMKSATPAAKKAAPAPKKAPMKARGPVSKISSLSDAMAANDEQDRISKRRG